MTIKHTSKFRQKVLSFLLGLSLLFNVLAPVTTVLADTLPTYTIDYYAVRDGFPYQHGGELSLYTETHPLDYAGVNDGSTAVTGPVGYVFSYWSSDEAGLNVVSWDQNYIPDTHENASYYAHFTQMAQRTIKVKPVSLWKEYDGILFQPNSYEVVEGSFDPWDDVWFDDMGIYYDGLGANAGTYQTYILGGLELAGGDAWKYRLEFLPGELTITKRLATITVDDKTQIYGDPDQMFSFSSDGFLGGEAPAPTDYRMSRIPGRNVDTYDINIFSNGTYTSDNYDIQLVPGTLQITPRPVQIIANDASKVYGDTDPSFTLETRNFLNGEAPTPADYRVTRPSAGTEEAVGIYGGSLVVTNIGGFSNRNYDISLISGTFEIMPRPEYRVDFDLNYAGAPANPGSQPVNVNAPYGALPVPDHRFGYTFAGWTTERWGGAEVTTYTIVTNTGNHTLYAQWILDTYRITYRPGTHGTFGQEEYHVIYGSLTPEFNNGQTPTGQFGYTFAGWDNPISNFVTQNADYTAQWVPATYQIQYDLDGGTNSTNNPSTYTFGVGVPDFEPATKDGHIFLGWFDGNDQEVTAIANTETGDQKLYAHFKLDQTRIEAEPIVRTILKNTTYTWQHTHHTAVLYDEDGIAVDAELWAIIDGKVYDADDLAELPEGVHQVTFTNVNPTLRFAPYSRLLARAGVREVTAETTATIIAEEAKPAPITIRYVDQGGKELKTSLVLTGKIGDTVASSAPMIAGYELISLSRQVNTVVTDKAQTFTFVYKATVQKPDLHIGTPTTGTPLPVAGTPLPTTGTPLPRTGERQESLQLLIGLLLVAVTSLLSWLKLGQLFAKARE